MSQVRTYDLKSNLTGGVSVKPGINLSGTTASNGAAVDCKHSHGAVYGEFAVATPTGTPTSFTITCKLQESADGSNNWADIANQSTALVLSAATTRGMVRAQPTKQYVRCVMTPAFVGGSAPTLDVGASVLFQKRSF